MLVLQPTEMCSSDPGTVPRGQDGSSLRRTAHREAQRVESHVPGSMWISSSRHPPTSPAALFGLALEGLVLLSHHAMTFSYRCLLPEWRCCFKAKVEKVAELVFPVEILYNKNMWMELKSESGESPSKMYKPDVQDRITSPFLILLYIYASKYISCVNYFRILSIALIMLHIDVLALKYDSLKYCEFRHQVITSQVESS